MSFSAAKDAQNLRKHGISLARAEDFDVDSAFFQPEDSQDYGEARWKAIGWLDASIYTLIFVVEQDRIRAISLRKATRQERKDYEENS